MMIPMATEMQKAANLVNKCATFPKSVLIPGKNVFLLILGELRKSFYTNCMYFTHFISFFF